MNIESPKPGFILIPIVALELIKAVGFIRRYRELCQECRSFAKAYEQTEQEYEKYFGHRRYEDYYSFKGVLHYHRYKHLPKRKKKEEANVKGLFD